MKLNCVDIDGCLEEFTQLEQKMTEVNGRNSTLEIMLEDANRFMKFYLTKEKSLVEERDSLLVTVNRLQQTLQEQCNLRMKAKDAEVKNLLENRDLDVEELKKRLKDQERERQSELLKLQMEFGAKLARVQSTAQWSQQQQEQQHGSNILPQSVYKRKLQFFQEEKNKEIMALRQRIKELEENQRAGGFSDSRLKKRKI